MSTKIRRREMDNYQCQICGDWYRKKYESRVIVEVHAHHIIPKSKGGETILDNLVTLCDLCHAVLHFDQRWKEYFGLSANTAVLEAVKEEFEEYIKLLFKKREETKRRV